MTDDHPDLNSETLTETVLHIQISSEAPYAKSVIMDMLEELASTLDFTGMYKGEIVVETPSGDYIESWALGADWDEPAAEDTT